MVGSIGGAARRAGLFALMAVAAMLALAVGSDSSSAGSGRGGLGPAPGATKIPDLRQVYPIRGGHRYWRGFSGEAGHEGVDIGARCGAPLVAAMGGKVRFAKYHGAAGNYVVIDTVGSTLELVYMHLSRPAAVRPGRSVATGQLVGFVGDTGNASGCHLHFEVWEGGYYRGGSPIDPMPFLQTWERQRKKRARARSRS